MVPKDLAVVCLIALMGAVGTTSLATADEAADHAALKQLVQEYESAIAKGDPSVLEPYLAPDFTGVMVTGEEANSFPALNEYWDKIQGLLGEGGKYSVKINIPEPAAIAGDVAYAHGTTDDTAVTSDGKEYKFQGFWTAICVRDGESWKIARIHGSMDAITNTFVMSAVRAAATPAALTGGFVGLAIGAVAAWIIARRRGASAAAA
jgi:ketosteroid isomerase-like protein